MKEVERWNWWLPTAGKPGKRHKSRWKMSREDAMKTDPTAEPVEGTREVLLVPEGPAEHQFNSKPPETP